ncbi:MAG: hypothetical protein IPM16_14585 [Chloroflexi bacterium]|nr:hypothetical protein [Chloroflexota bacterium]
MNPGRIVPRVVLPALIVVTLLAGLGAGLSRLGWDMDTLSERVRALHGPLMISGFLGTLICLERAVALAGRVRWALIVPAINAVGALAVLLWPDAIYAKGLFTSAGIGLTILYVYMLRMHPSRDVAIMGAGTVCWTIGNALWLSGQPIVLTVHLWTAFLILTIVGERLELSRVRRLTPLSERLLVGVVGVYIVGVLISPANLGLGVRVLGAGAVLVAAWLLRYDISRRTVKLSGLPRYIAICLILGYMWLAFGGAAAIWKGAIFAGPDYALVLHAFLLGFVFSMIFGHMPIILPAISGVNFQFSRVLYVPLAVLHVSMLLRTAANLQIDQAARQTAGLLNVIAILLFLATTAAIVVLSNRGGRQPAPA